MDTDNEEYSIYNTIKKAYENMIESKRREADRLEQISPYVATKPEPMARMPSSGSMSSPLPLSMKPCSVSATIKPVLKNHMVVFRYVDDGFEVAEKELKTKTLFVEATDDRDAVIYAMNVFRQEHDAKHVIHAFVVPSFDLNRIE